MQNASDLSTSRAHAIQLSKEGFFVKSRDMKNSTFIGLAVFIAMTFATTVARPQVANAGIGPGFKGPVGIQLYSLRAQLGRDVPGTLDEVQKWGIKYVELAGTYGLSPEEFRKQLDAHGIKAVSAHIGYERFRDDIDGVIREAKTLGLEYVGTAGIPHRGAFDEKTCRETAAVFNKAGEALSKAGLKFFYHVHGFEFQPYGDGKTLLDLLITETNPKYANYEMDVFWVVFPGQDPVKLLEKYPDRWPLLHIKGMKSGTKTGSLSGGTDPNNDVALGTGQIEYVPILSTAKKIGVKYYFIEDESSSSEQQIPQSLKYLETVKW